MTTGHPDRRTGNTTWIEDENPRLAPPPANLRALANYRGNPDRCEAWVHHPAERAHGHITPDHKIVVLCRGSNATWKPCENTPSRWFNRHYVCWQHAKYDALIEDRLALG